MAVNRPLHIVDFNRLNDDDLRSRIEALNALRAELKAQVWEVDREIANAAADLSRREQLRARGVNYPSAAPRNQPRF